MIEEIGVIDLTANQTTTINLNIVMTGKTEVGTTTTVDIAALKIKEDVAEVLDHRLSINPNA